MGLFDKSLTDYANELEAKLIKQVSKYKGIPVALSGGVDSSLLAALVEPEFVISVNLPGGDKYNEISYSSRVAQYLKLNHEIVNAQPKNFDTVMRHAVRAIGRPIPHFNIFPLYLMYERLSSIGITKVILGDGPDETMSGYGRNIIMKHIYEVLEYDSFKNYKPLIDKVLPEPEVAYAKMTGKREEIVRMLMKGHSLLKGMNRVDMELMRPDMDDMSDGIARYFGIKNIRPYQDNAGFDMWQMKLPDECKVHGEYGKFVLRVVAAKYLPREIAWRRQKLGGPVFPVNIFKKWRRSDGEFGKKSWLKYQTKLLGRG